MKTYTVEPMNEPDGPGNGWSPCDPADATQWGVWDRFSVVESFDTREAALAFVRAAITEPR